MLKKCPECELQVSDKAVLCPHCGYPFKKEAKNITRKHTRRKRLPNGFGQISEIKNRNLRKPFRAMVTTGKDEYGRPISKLLKPHAYFSTYNEAYEALLEYNKNPYALGRQVTVRELFDLWSESYTKRNHKDSIGSMYQAAWKYCYPLYDLPVKELHTWQIKHCIETSTRVINGEERAPSENIKRWMKFLLCVMFDYAVEYEMTDRNYARLLSNKSFTEINDDPKEESHISFTDSELETLWENINVPGVDLLLIQCYSGWRPQELGLIRRENVDLDKNIIKGGMKTKAGINRTVPIHPRIKSLIEQKYKESEGRMYLLNTRKSTSSDRPSLTYVDYKTLFAKVIKALDLDPRHKPHDGRKTFITLAKKYKVDEYAIKYIVGHAIQDLTEATYTNRDDQWLYEEISKIK